MIYLVSLMILSAAAVLLLYAILPFLWGKGLQFFLHQNVKGKRKIVLTFDDGPGYYLTPVILDMLAQRNVKASFFLLGRNIPGREEIVRRIAWEGHEICSHGYDHLRYWRCSPLRTISDIQKGWRELDNLLRRSGSRYPFRPPYGKMNLACLVYLLIRKVPIYYWTLDVRDTWLESKREENRILPTLQKRKGAIVLMHDFDRKCDSTNKLVLNTVEAILSFAEKEGMTVCTMSDFFGRDGSPGLQDSNLQKNLEARSR